MRYFRGFISLWAPLFLALGFGAEVETNSRNIIGGRDTDSVEFPSVVYVGGCSGTIVAPGWALTTAHCVDYRTSGGFRIERGWPEDHEKRIAREIVMHPEYVKEPSYTTNDIALVQFKPFESATVAIQDLGGSHPAVGTSVISVGWGRIDGSGTRPSRLQTAEFTVVRCPDWMNGIGAYLADTNTICRDATNVLRTATGDSGSPIFTKVGTDYVQVGIHTYYDYKDGEPGQFSIGEGIALHTEWIETVVASGRDISGRPETLYELQILMNEIDVAVLSIQKDLADITYPRIRELRELLTHAIHGTQDLRNFHGE